MILDYEDLIDINPNPEEDMIEDWNKLESVTHEASSNIETNDDGV